MMTINARADMLALLERFRVFWEGSGAPVLASLFTPEAGYASSHRGEASGVERLIEVVASDFESAHNVRLDFTNQVACADADVRVVAAYFHGSADQAGGSASFGGMLVLGLVQQGDTLRIASVRQQLGWIKGNQDALPGWTRPSTQLWQPGDPPATIVSELDAPQHRVRCSTLELSDEEAVAQAWYTYAWALDMSDTSLYEKCFTEHASAVLPPMGDLQGRRMLTATLKAFRMPWPSIQHYGAPIEIVVEQDGQGASLVLGRIIPGATKSPDGTPIYGAHYRIALRREQETWKIQRMKYHPGWISAG